MIDKKRVVMVEWIDAASMAGWCTADDLADLPGAARVKTVGWFIEEDKEAVTLAMSLSEFKYGDLMRIPHGTIVSREVIKEIE